MEGVWRGYSDLEGVFRSGVTSGGGVQIWRGLFRSGGGIQIWRGYSDLEGVFRSGGGYSEGVLRSGGGYSDLEGYSDR
jgi:hypothetical protein